jgi:hypothetical protein
MSNDLGTIKKIDDLRGEWKDGEKDFTKWLVNNIHDINDKLDMELIDVVIEQPSGKYRADIVAVDNKTKNKVIIENQLEQTDHDHLGKAITYASVHNAKAVIWIAADFTQEHVRALDWLNHHTKKSGIKFYGIQVELFQTGDRKPKVFLRIVKKLGRVAPTDKKDKDWEKLNVDELIARIGDKNRDFREQLQAIERNSKEKIDEVIAIIKQKPKPPSKTILTNKLDVLLKKLQDERLKYN